MEKLPGLRNSVKYCITRLNSRGKEVPEVEKVSPRYSNICVAKHIFLVMHLFRRRKRVVRSAIMIQLPKYFSRHILGQ